MKHSISWNTPGELRYHAGLDRAVLYPKGEAGVPWNGLVSIDQAPSGGQPKPYFLDGVLTHNRLGPEYFAGTIKAFTYPHEFAVVDGQGDTGEGLFFEQQARKQFGISYRTKVGNDTVGLAHDYEIHLVYNMMTLPNSVSQATIQNVVTPVNFSWGFITTPLQVAGRKHTAKLRIRKSMTDPEKMDWLESALYGYGGITQPRLPTMSELAIVFNPSYTFPGTGAP